MDFTFAVMAYNQQNLIIETLESIKYQTEKYGQTIKVSLIILDDGSKDKTTEYAKCWVKKNQLLFSHSKVIVNETNKGVVENFFLLMQQIDTENFKIIAADDVFGCENFFLNYDGLGKHQFKCFVPTYLQDGQLFFREDILEKMFFNMEIVRRHGNILKAFRMGGFLHTPSLIYKKNIYLDAKCSEFMSKFKLFEDDPMYYIALKRLEDINVSFINAITVLYRIHDGSISNAKKHNNPFDEEMRRLKKIYVQDARGFEKIIMKSATTKLPKYLRVDKYYLAIRRKHIHRILQNNKDFIEFKQGMMNKIEKEKMFYNLILEKAKEFIDKMEAEECEE